MPNSTFPNYDDITEMERNSVNPDLPIHPPQQEIEWQWLLPVMLVPFLCMILLIFEKEQQRLLNVNQNVPLDANDQNNIPSALRQSIWGRASHALMTGLSDQRPQMVELANRILQEDRIHNQTVRASRDEPPSYENPLLTASSSPVDQINTFQPSELHQSSDARRGSDATLHNAVSNLTMTTLNEQNSSSRIVRIPAMRRESESSIMSVLPSYSMTNMEQNYPYLYSPRSSSAFRTTNIVRPIESRTRTSPVMSHINE